MQRLRQQKLTVEPQLPLPLGEAALQSNDGEGEDVKLPQLPRTPVSYTHLTPSLQGRMAAVRSIPPATRGFPGAAAGMCWRA